MIETKLACVVEHDDDINSHLSYFRYYDYFNKSRLDLLYKLFGVTDENLKELGMSIVVTETRYRHLRPIKKGDEITITSRVKREPCGGFIFSDHEIYDSKNELSATASITQRFKNRETEKSYEQIPHIFMESIRKYFP